MRSSVPADHRSAHPNLPGVPWWGAVLIAVALTAAGFAFDAGSGKNELTSAFAAMYIIGCVAAVLAVRQSGVFTAVVQPPLILFVAVPSAYYLFHHSEIQGVKDILINCGYPLIERFLLMFTTSVVVLLIGMVRWYFGAASRAGIATPKAEQEPGAVSGMKARVSSLFGGPTADVEEAGVDATAAAPLKHGIDRPATAQKARRSERPAKRTPPTRSRHARPPVDDLDAPPPEPRRSRRSTHSRDVDPDDRSDRSRRPTVGKSFDDPDAPPPRRRPRVPRDPDARTPPPREYRRDARDPRDRAEPRERPTRRPDRYDPAEPYEPPPRRRPVPGTSSNGTHHPVSKVRYRGSDAEDGENHVEYRRPPRGRHSLDDWRYES
ncbi:hypothetical protein BH09ACT7_BH09ACT7_38680 [soil metagenome]